MTRERLGHIILSVPTPLPYTALHFRDKCSLRIKLSGAASQEGGSFMGLRLSTHWMLSMVHSKDGRGTDRASLVLWQLLAPPPITVALAQKLASC